MKKIKYCDKIEKVTLAFIRKERVIKVNQLYKIYIEITK